ncbi:MAG: hypothetical protein M0T82_16650 [Desulfobacteraceae bacterium]|nr:hypothetical protein [Desulfobacteraceae bacterium]
MIKENPTTEEILKNVMHSTENALMALSQLEQNLIRGRFKEGAAPYATMCKTLVGQRIWTCDKQDEKINKNFKKISNTARNIIDIFTPYVENLKKLTMIDKEIVFEQDQTHEVADAIDDEVANDVLLVQDEEKVISAIKSSPKKQISYTKLRSMLGWNRKKLDGVLNRTLQKTGAITITMSGSRKMITFVP